MFIYNTNNGFNGGKCTKEKKKKYTKRIQKGAGHRRKSSSGKSKSRKLKKTKSKKRKRLTRVNQLFLKSLGLKLKKKK